jgi:hypothetical protein
VFLFLSPVVRLFLFLLGSLFFWGVIAFSPVQCRLVLLTHCEDRLTPLSESLVVFGLRDIFLRPIATPASPTLRLRFVSFTPITIVRLYATRAHGIGVAGAGLLFRPLPHPTFCFRVANERSAPHGLACEAK